MRVLGCLCAHSGPSLKPGVPDRVSAHSLTAAVGLQERETLKTPRTPPGLDIGHLHSASLLVLMDELQQPALGGDLRTPFKGLRNVYVLLPIRFTLNLAQEKSPKCGKLHIIMFIKVPFSAEVAK